MSIGGISVCVRCCSERSAECRDFPRVRRPTCWGLQSCLHLAVTEIEGSNVGVIVKADIHPRYETIEARCACGNKFLTRSTSDSIHVEICSQCHPFFTGKQKLVDTAGRVERFKQRYGKKDDQKGE